MAKTKMSWSEMEKTLVEFTDANFSKYKSHGYTAGFLQSQLLLAMVDMPLRKQKEIMEVFKRATPVA